ncbi:DNA-directed RNA polymerase subunit alpha [Candidatus Wolfebacteria bacterium]|nr:MAG: DNA-directed RNA polymerase subunit alpha [Candidatus Wolfebacteria bacterium]
MSEYNILLPSKPRIVLEEDTKGVYEIDNLYPGYGHTLGNSLRRIILSSLPGAAITSLKIDGVSHEFSVIDGVKEDVITILLNLKKVRFKMLTDEPQKVTISVKGPHKVTAADITSGGQVEVLNKDLFIADVTDKNTNLNIEMTVEKGLGFVSKEVLQKEKVEVGEIAVDAIFSPVQRVSYEVENMRVGDKTNHNRLRISIDTDGTITPREALEKSIEIMITQLQAIFDFKGIDEIHEEAEKMKEKAETEEPVEEKVEEKEDDFTDVMKTRIDTLDFSSRTANALDEANIRTVGGLARKSAKDLLELKGLGEKGIKEIKKALGNFGITLKE